MADMLVKLYHLEEDYSVLALKEKGIHIKRVLSPDKHLVEQFIRQHFSEAWVSEASVALTKVNPSCFIAIKDQAIIGFACYDATAKGFFGPTGIDEAHRGNGAGAALLMKCLLAMREEGYGYAIIGGVGKAKPFYEKICHESSIDDSNPTVYSRMVGYK